MYLWCGLCIPNNLVSQHSVLPRSCALNGRNIMLTRHAGMINPAMRSAQKCGLCRFSGPLRACLHHVPVTDSFGREIVGNMSFWTARSVVLLIWLFMWNFHSKNTRTMKKKNYLHFISPRLRLRHLQWQGEVSSSPERRRSQPNDRSLFCSSSPTIQWYTDHKFWRTVSFQHMRISCRDIALLGALM